MTDQEQGRQTRPKPRKPKDPYAERVERLDVQAPRFTDDREILVKARGKIHDLGDECLSIEIKGKKPDPENPRALSVWFVTCRVARLRDHERAEAAV